MASPKLNNHRRPTTMKTKLLFKTLFSILAVLTLHAQSDLPIVNVSAPTNSVPESNQGYFVFTSNQTNGVTLRVEYSGTTNWQDFSRISFWFPTNLTIPPNASSFTQILRVVSDSLIE